MAKQSKYARISDTDKKRIIRDLERWGRGEIAQKLTWDALTKRYGFTRQSLSDHTDIKHAKRCAEAALRSLPVARQTTADEVAQLRSEIEALKQRVAEHERRERLWKARWQRIAFHVRQKGMQMSLVDRPAEGDVPSERESARILKMFDRPIPPVRAREEPKK
ncbi:protein kinase [Sediminicurvatus halobius]|uniref:protein kinase n=1 Tax=Sediminicurvatus halobius TaxID=2182432 RepID=UPI0011B29D3F|nr:protein kinase [Spiribacter halobius]UEX78757.1 hypothetical protein LMH63_03680 [Spiribacter halobius]